MRRTLYLALAVVAAALLVGAVLQDADNETSSLEITRLDAQLGRLITQYKAAEDAQPAVQGQLSPCVEHYRDGACYTYDLLDLVLPRLAEPMGDTPARHEPLPPACLHPDCRET